MRAMRCKDKFKFNRYGQTYHCDLLRGHKLPHKAKLNGVFVEWPAIAMPHARRRVEKRRAVGEKGQA